MKTITLNSDGTLNILDPRKTYILIINWDEVDDYVSVHGIKYYKTIKYNTDDVWTFEREGGRRFRSFRSKDLQYAIDACLRYITDERAYRGCSCIIEFSSDQEFQEWKSTQSMSGTAV